MSVHTDLKISCWNLDFEFLPKKKKNIQLLYDAYLLYWYCMMQELAQIAAIVIHSKIINLIIY